MPPCHLHRTRWPCVLTQFRRPDDELEKDEPVGQRRSVRFDRILPRCLCINQDSRSGHEEFPGPARAIFDAAMEGEAGVALKIMPLRRSRLHKQIEVFRADDGPTGWTRGAPSPFTVARYASRPCNRSRPTAASSGAVQANSLQPTSGLLRIVIPPSSLLPPP